MSRIKEESGFFLRANFYSLTHLYFPFILKKTIAPYVKRNEGQTDIRRKNIR